MPLAVRVAVTHVAAGSRLKELAGILISALGDEVDTVQELDERLMHGCRPEGRAKQAA